MSPRIRKLVGLLALALSAGACAHPAERQWQKVGVTPAIAQRDETECLTAAGLQRAPMVYAGSAAGPGRDVDFGGRGYAAYVACMEAKGYTRPDR